MNCDDELRGDGLGRREINRPARGGPLAIRKANLYEVCYVLGSFCLGALSAVNKVHDHAEYDARY